MEIKLRKRLIYAGDLWHKTFVCEEPGDFRKAIENAPSVDAVEVPCRCKDCKYWKHFANVGCTDFAKVCTLANYMIGANGYCLYGERR